MRWRKRQPVARAEAVVEPLGTIWVDEFPVPIKNIYLMGGEVHFEADVTNEWDRLPQGGVWRIADPDGNTVVIVRLPFDKERWQPYAQDARWSGGTVTLTVPMRVDGARPGETWARSEEGAGQ